MVTPPTGQRPDTSRVELNAPVKRDNTFLVIYGFAIVLILALAYGFMHDRDKATNITSQTANTSAPSNTTDSSITGSGNMTQPMTGAPAAVSTGGISSNNMTGMSNNTATGATDSSHSAAGQVTAPTNTTNASNTTMR